MRWGGWEPGANQSAWPVEWEERGWLALWRLARALAAGAFDPEREREPRRRLFPILKSGNGVNDIVF